jgi:hypothetical protein
MRFHRIRESLPGCRFMSHIGTSVPLRHPVLDERGARARSLRGHGQSTVKEAFAAKGFDEGFWRMAMFS